MPESTIKNVSGHIKIICVFLCLVMLLFLSGCPYESREPLGALADGKIDGKLLGRWKYEDKEHKEAGFITISRFNDRELLIVIEENGKKIPDMMRGFVTMVEGRNFLNLQELKGAYGDRKWIIVNYKTDDGSLTYRVVNDSLARASGDKAPTSRQLFELIRKNLTNSDIYDEPISLTCVGK